MNVYCFMFIIYYMNIIYYMFIIYNICDCIQELPAAQPLLVHILLMTSHRAEIPLEPIVMSLVKQQVLKTC